MIGLIGNQGNMGSRYCAVLKHIGAEFHGVDIRQKDYEDQFEKVVTESNKIIVAVPTSKHLEVIQKIGRIRSRKSLETAHVLCEKPVVTSTESLKWLRKEQESGALRIFSVNQYAHHYEYALFSKGEGRTHYNYFKHGGDGLAWDCFPLFVLAKGSITLDNRSPIWKCRINGVMLNLTGIDYSYIAMVDDFLRAMNRVWDLDVIEIGVRKVLKWMAEEEADILQSMSNG